MPIVPLLLYINLLFLECNDFIYFEKIFYMARGKSFTSNTTEVCDFGHPGNTNSSNKDVPEISKMIVFQNDIFPRSNFYFCSSVGDFPLSNI